MSANYGKGKGPGSRPGKGDAGPSQKAEESPQVWVLSALARIGTKPKLISLAVEESDYWIASVKGYRIRDATPRASKAFSVA